MKAAVNERYGSPDVLAIRDVPTPAPKEREILIKIHATTVSRTDCGNLRGRPALFVRPVLGYFRPRQNILGMDFAGSIEATGAGVELFEPGDRVFGLSPQQFGAHAQYMCLAEDAPIAVLPADVGFHEAVVCEGAWYANTYLEAFDVKPGDKILIYGASGAIGTAAVQLAKHYGAEITAVVSTRHLDLATSLGADRTVDYTAEDFTAIGETYDYVLDAVGKTTYFQCRKLLEPEGVFSATDLGPYWQNIALSAWSTLVASRRVTFPLPKVTKQLIEYLRDLLAARKFRAVVDRTYRLDQIADAYRYVETAQKTGIVVLDVAA